MPVHESIAAEKSRDISGSWLMFLTYSDCEDCAPVPVPGRIIQTGNEIEYRSAIFGSIATGAVWQDRIYMEIDIDGYLGTFVGTLRGPNQFIGFWRDMNGDSGIAFGRRR
jgi:hypothetical protein